MKLPDVIFAAVLMTVLSSPASAEATCESLASLSLPQTTITLAQTVALVRLLCSRILSARQPAGSSPARSQTGQEKCSRASPLFVGSRQH
jgi:hypothetical protein